MILIKKNLETIFLVCLLLIASFFRFYQIERADITNDAAMYSFRSIGYLDYTASDLQTTPLDWFGHFHWWSKLSFHDAPPLVFLIQHLFFKFFNVSLFVARLPFVIFGILTILIFYFLAKELYGKNVAMLASFLLTIDAYHTLSSQSGLLEPILLFFVTLSLWFFKKGLADSKYLVVAALFLGLSLLCKYLALFLLLAFFLIFIFDKNFKKFLSDWKFYAAILVFLAVVSPLVIYNIEMYQARGHLDMQLALLFGQKQQDWTSISSRQVGVNISQNFFTFFAVVKNSSIVAYWLFLISLFYLLVKIIFYRQKRHFFIGLVLLSLFIFFSLVGAGSRYLAILPPFVFLVVAIFLIDLTEEFKKLKYYVFGLIGILIIYLAVFNLNSNQFVPFGKADLTYSSYREDNWGYNQLEKYWTDQYLGVDKLRSAKINTLEETYLANDLEKIPEIFKGNLLIYDSKINWFAKEWYFYRWIIYYHLPFLSADEFVEVVKDERGINLLNSLSGKNLFFIKATKNVFLDAGEANRSTNAELLEGKLLEQKIEPMEIIYNPKGEEAFKIYKVPHLIRGQK